MGSCCKDRDDVPLHLPDIKDPEQCKRFTARYDKNPDSAIWTTVWVVWKRPEKMFEKPDNLSDKTNLTFIQLVEITL